MDELYKQEVLELTELLKNDEEWEDLRNILIQKGFNLSKTVLVSFVEDDKGNEYGVIVTKDIQIIEYSKLTQHEKNNIDIFKLKNITNEKDKINKYPQIPIAIDMIKNKEIL
ncbi:MAG: hypothetical protein ACLR02_15415 [Clostridium sp.]|jgi:autonomous glycyl radical cofactor GrcA